MENSFLLEAKLDEISNILQKKYVDEPDIGVLTGISGMALFQFYYSKYLDVDKFTDIGAEMISLCVEKINHGYSIPAYCSGVAGLGWVIQHLTMEEFITLDCDSLLSQFDGFLENQMLLDFKNGHYDFLHGALGYSFYFLNRYKHTEDPQLKKRYYSYLIKSVSGLKKNSISKNNTLKWKSITNIETGAVGFNLSLSHGISSIIAFLSRMHEIDVFKELTEDLIRGSVNYILSFLSTAPENLSLLPSRIEKESSIEYNSRIAWCYGDLGIGLSLFHAGKSLDDDIIIKQALLILNHTTTRRFPNETMVVDAGICHGSFGNAIIYQKLFREKNDETFKNAFEFWIGDGMQKATHENGYAGYKQWKGFEKSWAPELSLLEGVAGIGLSIINNLSDQPSNWDECLVIS